MAETAGTYLSGEVRTVDSMRMGFFSSDSDPDKKTRGLVNGALRSLEEVFASECRKQGGSTDPLQTIKNYIARGRSELWDSGRWVLTKDDRIPFWALVFFCLRSGDWDSALKALGEETIGQKELQNVEDNCRAMKRLFERSGGAATGRHPFEFRGGARGGELLQREKDVFHRAVVSVVQGVPFLQQPEEDLTPYLSLYDRLWIELALLQSAERPTTTPRPSGTIAPVPFGSLATVQQSMRTILTSPTAGTGSILSVYPLAHALLATQQPELAVNVLVEAAFCQEQLQIAEARVDPLSRIGDQEKLPGPDLLITALQLYVCLAYFGLVKSDHNALPPSRAGMQYVVITEANTSILTPRLEQIICQNLITTPEAQEIIHNLLSQFV